MRLTRDGLDGVDLVGASAPDLARALAAALDLAFALFLQRAQVVPGVAVAAPPPSGSGASTGPGALLAAPAGAPAQAELEPLVASQLRVHGLRGEGVDALVRVVAAALAQALACFIAQTVVAPGIAIASFATAAPGSLTGAPIAAQTLEPSIASLCRAEGLRGEGAEALAKALAKALAGALSELRTRARVAPGVPCTPAATAAPGRLV